MGAEVTWAFPTDHIELRQHAAHNDNLGNATEIIVITCTPQQRLHVSSTTNLVEILELLIFSRVVSVWELLILIIVLHKPVNKPKGGIYSTGARNSWTRLGVIQILTHACTKACTFGQLQWTPAVQYSGVPPERL